MLRDLLEGFKYTNHLWPIVILRLYVGYFFFSSALDKKAQEYALSPNISALIDQNLFAHRASDFINSFYTNFVQTNWYFFSQFQVNFEWFVGILFFIGFLNRPVAILSMVYVLFASYLHPMSMSPFYIQLEWILLTLLVFGSGRVAGVDYFFYKRQRGLIW